MKRLVLLVGIPASGKTTLANRLVERGYLCLNADSVRQELWGDSSSQREPEKVFALFFARLEDALAKELDIVIDNTNTNPKHREQVIARAKNVHYSDIQLWVLDVPLKTCLERNAKRERAVDEEIIKNMFQTLYGSGKPKHHEGRLVIIKPGKGEGEFRFFLPRSKK